MSFRKVTIQGGAATWVDLSARAKDAVAQQAKYACEALATLVCNAVKDVINESVPSGRLYRIPGTKKGRKRRNPATAAAAGTTTGQYRASAPGQPPAERTGEYSNSWIASPAEQDGDHIAAFAYTPEQVGKSGEHNLGLILEYGAPKASIEPRPHVQQAVARVDVNGVHHLIRKALQKAPPPPPSTP